jgi:hypothetical protein
MRKKRIIQLMVILGILGFCLGNSAMAQKPLVSFPPGGQGWISHSGGLYYTIDFDNYRDMEYDERAAADIILNNICGGHVSITTGTAAFAYNCNGYIFMSSSAWLQDYSLILETVFVLSDSGNIWLFPSDHSAYTSGLECGYQWYAKCGNYALAYHDETVYGYPMYQGCF